VICALIRRRRGRPQHHGVRPSRCFHSDIAVARQKTVQVLEKLRDLGLSLQTADLALRLWNC
jgi:hypothetical protein